MDGRMLDFVALGVLCFVVLTIIYGVIFIHDIPYEIARKRKHPHQDAIHTAGWVSLFLMHTIWPFLWIWATLYKPGYGWGIRPSGGEELTQKEPSPTADAISALKVRIEQLEKEKAQLQHTLVRKIKEMDGRIKELESHRRGEEV